MSEGTANDIGDVCERNEIKNLTSKVANCTGQVLIGLLPPEEFPAALEKEVGLKKPVAKKVAQEIFRTVFFPVRIFLAELYHTALGSSETPSVTPSSPSITSTPSAPSASQKSDTYREPIE
ncbi:MAG: hypothetical protein AAB871_01680 [Patescibacteria group bacterium]